MIILSSLSLLSNEIVYAAGWTIIHSIWQCCLIALLIAISYSFTKTTSAATRYWINAFGLLTCVVASGVTFYLNFYNSSLNTILGTTQVIKVSQNISHIHARNISDTMNQYISQIVAVWLIGFAFYISKYITELFYCQHIKNNNYKMPNQEWLKLFNELKNSVGINYSIQLRLSNIVSVPCVVGHFKPVVLLPASLVLGLSIKQIEVILLHELGHVRRNDYLINSLQTAITLLYFFNPFARWIASKIDEERENACDDIAVSVSGDPMFYANTLKEFAEMKNMYSPTVALTRGKNLLLNRIKRLFFKDTSFVKIYGKASVIMGIFLLTIGYSVAGYSDADLNRINTFTIKLDNEPLSNLLKKAEQQCSISIEKTTLQHLDRPISGNFPDLHCDTVGNFIRGLDRGLDSTFTGISINEKDIPLKNLVKRIENYCPEAKGTVQLKNPDTLVSFQTESLPCDGISSIIQKMDTSQKNVSLSIGKISTINFGDQGPDEYDQTFFKEFYFPKEIQEKGYAGNCTLTMDVDTNGQATNINSVCYSKNEEQEQYFENLLSERAKQTKFPIKMENAQAVVAKDVAIRAVWRSRI